MTAASVALTRLLASVEMARAYTLAVMLTILGSFAIESMSGLPTLLAAEAALCVIGVLILVVRREELTLLRLAPTTLLFFVVWALASALWSTGAGKSFQGWCALVGVAILAIVVGHIRDTLQTVRALGDALRWMLAISLGMEIFSGLLIDMPITFLAIEGNLAFGGPLQGIFGSRNMLGFIAVIAVITFEVERRTLSVPQAIAVPSVVLAGLLAVMSASPTVLVLAVAVGVATIALSLVRRADTATRPRWQWTIAIVTTLGLIVAFVLRHPIIRMLDAGSDFSTRADLWNVLLDYWQKRPIHGWGWYGPWQTGQYPLNAINYFTDDRHASALNAYFDTLLQLGAAGLVLFLLLGGIALVRSWLVASIRRSIVYAWTPLVLVTLAVDSMFESFTLTGAGWFLLVLCALRAGQSRSWRENIDAAQTGTITTLPPEENHYGGDGQGS
ncbi:O-antigen ligase family protein [Microbacterium sp. YY-01]|uniref:O-antigen ligase family protein n=1 Tax=Microbacterium sp. YY-01 TaxID=3421634 RepID=UPI003D16BCE6